MKAPYISILALVASLVACDAPTSAPPAESAPATANEPASEAVAPEAAAPEAAAPQAAAPEAAAPQAAAPEAGAPEATGTLPAAVAAGAPFSGEVRQTMDSGGYTYMLLDTGDGEVWVAAQRFDTSVGERVHVGGGMVMRSFHSNTLDRTFDAIVFASSAGPLGDAPPLPPGTPTNLPAGHPPIEAAPQTP